MLRVLKGHRHSEPKEYIGVIGSYYIEILDTNPFIPKFLRTINSPYLHVPSEHSRFLSPHERMVLKSHENNSLVILINEPSSEDDICVILLFEWVKVNQTPQELLTDALRLAGFRWSNLKVGNSHYPLKRPLSMPHVVEILAALLSKKN